jgi:hypothetical protein
MLYQSHVCRKIKEVQSQFLTGSRSPLIACVGELIEAESLDPILGPAGG